MSEIEDEGRIRSQEERDPRGGGDSTGSFGLPATIRRGCGTWLVLQVRFAIWLLALSLAIGCRYQKKCQGHRVGGSRHWVKRDSLVHGHGEMCLYLVQLFGYQDSVWSLLLVLAMKTCPLSTRKAPIYWNRINRARCQRLRPWISAASTPLGSMPRHAEGHALKMSVQLLLTLNINSFASMHRRDAQDAVESSGQVSIKSATVRDLLPLPGRVTECP